MMKPVFSLLALGALAACTGLEPRVSVPDAPTEVRARTSFPSIEMREVSLPTYASAEELSVQRADGTIATNADLLWADDPARAITLSLARQVALITGATVAPEPWPFDAYAAGRVDVRFTNVLARADNTLQVSGQYFVVDSEGRGRDRAVLFDIAEPIAAPSGPAQMAEARARAITALAVDIAQKGL